MTTKLDKHINENGFPDPKEKLGYLFWQINMQWVRRVNQLVSQHELTHTQLITLVATHWMSTKKEEVIQQDLVDAIKIDRMLVSKMVKKNVEAGLLVKKSSEKDSRVNVLELTSAGHEKIIEVLPVMHKAETEFYSSLGNKKEIITKELQQILEHIESFMNQTNQQ